MAKTIYDPVARADLFSRVDRLQPTAPAKWGRFTAPKMVAHLVSAVQMALGEQPVKARSSLLGNPIVRRLVIYYLPWPKGAPTAPEMLARAPEAWSDDITTLKAAIERAAAKGARATWAPHPAFGALSGTDWGVLIHRHVHHHLTQFGA